ncbi:MAG: DUF72 domain-containing protein [Thermoguttaceae bacterium]|jgi:uncharacterized protein YecE (DUF72 family)
MKPNSLYVGTSGWTYDDWAGVFYPAKVKGPERLAFYAQQFNAVEVNATFYRFPTQAMLDAWNRRLPAEFHLVVKGSRVVTHLKKLDNCWDSSADFCDRIGQLRTLRVILWQLPPSLHKDVPRLKRFLAALPTHVRHAVEFRHASWWDDDVAGELARHEAAFVAISHPTLPDTIYPTTDFVYLRFHGLGQQLYLYDYSDRELASWAQRIRSQLQSRILYAFFNNDYHANAPRNAATFRRLLETSSVNT